MDEHGTQQGTKVFKSGSSPRATSPPGKENSTTTVIESSDEEKARESLQWQQALTHSLSAVAECVRAIPPGIDTMDASLADTLEYVAEECRNAIPAERESPKLGPRSADSLEKRMMELESNFRLMIAYAKANAHAIARAYNRTCIRLTDLLSPLLDKNELVPLDFPDTIGQFQQLSKEAVLNLLITYQVPGIPDTDEERRIDLARYIGVNL